MKPILYTTLICTLILACTRYPAGVEETLSQAGKNRGELEKVLRHYRQHPEDSLKYQAACFLIDNMKWHLSTEQAIFPDSSIYEWHARFDSLYKDMTKGIRDTALNTRQNAEKFWENYTVARKLVNAIPPDTPVIVKGIFPDPQHISSGFLISHIENAFHVWTNSPHASYLSFEQFKEMILPYRAITGYPFYENGKRANDIFSKYLNMSDEKTYNRFINRYSHYTYAIRYMFYLPQKQHVGLYDLFLGSKYDCISIADNFCTVFRAYGIPTAVDCNISFRERTGRHFHCTLLDSAGKRYKYNQITSRDTLHQSASSSISYFRNTFAARADSPFMLKAKDEVVPDYFDTPCIKEVTDENYRTTRIEIPLNRTISNNLVYLYTFNNLTGGLVPATWGSVNHQQKETNFQNVVYNVLYFPVYLKGDSVIPYADPFYISSPDTLYTSPTFTTLRAEQPDKRGKLLLLRKFPEKKYLQQQARFMIGGRFEGANREDFKDSVLLATIETTPILNLQEIIPKVCRPFRYYRYVAPDTWPISNMGFLEFLTDEYTPQDSLQAVIPLPVFTPEDIDKNRDDKTYRRLHPDDSIKYYYLRNHPAYNPIMQYSSYAGKDLMPLKRPMKVKKIRFAPANAENHIVVGHSYVLMYWDNAWKKAGTRIARYNFLEFDNVPLGRIYWLRDLTAGKEELPFFYKNGKQLFIYHDTIVPRPAEFYDFENHY